MDISTLWTRIQQGDEIPFNVLYKKFQPGLKRYAFIFLNDHSLAEEMVDDVYLKILQNRGTLFFSDGDQFRNFLYSATHNMCMDALKKNRTKKAGMITLISSQEWMSLSEKHGDDDCFAEKIEKDELAAAIESMVEKMPEKRRIAFRLKNDEGMTTGEIAEQMGITESTVRSHLQTARKEIEKKLNSIRR